MTEIIDVSYDCGAQAAALGAAGVKTVMRYYSRDTIRPSKPLRRAEADKLTAAGLRLGIVYEGRYGDKAFNFDRATGVADGVYARHYAATEIDQPAGSTIYFAVDFDATAAEIRDRILPWPCWTAASRKGPGFARRRDGPAMPPSTLPAAGH